MNPRQRRGVLLMVLSVGLAIAVFFGVASYVDSVNRRVGPMVTVYQATEDLNAFSQLTADRVEAVSVPAQWTDEASRLTVQDIEGRTIAVPLSAGSRVTMDILVPPSDLNPNEREVAINVDAVTGIAGRVRPGDRVDVYSVFSDVPGLANQSRILVRNVRVVSVGGTQQVEQRETGAIQDVVPVTLALVPQDALAVTYASTFAEQVRLIGLPAGTTQDREGEVNQFDAEELGGEAIIEEGFRP
ncbi:Flp pilus assembly protein CpaB [Ornithinimicrobium humiphilum]|uniref:Pilus assembly protein CpaB n=1 Tax=Ornithinimicrobium humiphilum TaxID=125288 RepID=A0A543KL85_9MICO|nr:Flp pilus assembly protein CpaB [Ornithinimicrobium humiphilum]TQM95804.1 pilus assembly protein CpaB [Ornithinimicrobium humiphilum]